MSAKARLSVGLAAFAATAAPASPAGADSFTPVRLAVSVSPVGARGLPLAVAVTVSADPGVLDTATSPLRMRVKLTASECGGSFATTDGTVLLDQPMNPQPATGHAYDASARGSGRPSRFGRQTVCAFLETEGDGRMYANDTSDPPPVAVTRACTAAATRDETSRAALARAQRQLRRTRSRAAKARLRALVARRSKAAAADRRAARAACGPNLPL